MLRGGLSTEGADTTGRERSPKHQTRHGDVSHAPHRMRLQAAGTSGGDVRGRFRASWVFGGGKSAVVLGCCEGLPRGMRTPPRTQVKGDQLLACVLIQVPFLLQAFLILRGPQKNDLRQTKGIEW